MRVGEPFLSCLLTAGISSKLLCSYNSKYALPHTMHSVIMLYIDKSIIHNERKQREFHIVDDCSFRLLAGHQGST